MEVDVKITMSKEYTNAKGVKVYPHPEFKLVIYQSNRNGFNINVVRDKLEDGTFVNRFTIPQSAATMQGVVFLHKAGFLMATDTKENAIANAMAFS